jgi:hypothetical protein
MREQDVFENEILWMSASQLWYRTGCGPLFLLETWSSHADFNRIQIEVGHGKKAIVIFVPVPSLQGFHKVQQR